MANEQRVGALTARDMLDSQLDSYATRGFEDFLVTLPEEPDFPFEIKHNLRSELPTGIRYEVIQSTYPVTLYHRPDDLFGPGVISLRATAGGGTRVRIRLTADDGDASPMLEPDSTQVSQFPNIVRAGKTFGSEYDFLAALDATGAPQDRAGNFIGNTAGPALLLDTDVDDASWIVQADITSGSFNPRLVFAASRDSAAFAMAIHPDASNTADKWWLVPAADGELNLGGTNTAAGGNFSSSSAQRINNAYFKNIVDSTLGYYERSRSTPMGEWQNVSFAAGNFTANGSMTWTVASGDQVTYQYTLVGKTLFVNVFINTSTLGGVANTQLLLPVPGGFTSAKSVSTLGWAFNGGAGIPLLIGVSGTTITCQKADLTNWTLETDATQVRFHIGFEIS